jgi:uncharacterized membrane protein YphA (DoxX/SURF4 family)
MTEKPILSSFKSICRIMIAVIFIFKGYDKLVNLDAVYQVVHKEEFFFQTHALIILYSICEFVFGLFFLVGYKIRLMAILLACQVLLLNLGMHDFWSMLHHEKILNFQLFIKNLIVVFALLYIAASEPDKHSLDQSYIDLEIRNKKRKKK